METIPKWMQDHIDDDHRFQEHMEKDIIPMLAKREDIKGLATEKSVRELIHWQKNILAAGVIISNGSKWGYRIILIVATLVGAIGVITGAWKAWFAWLFFNK